MVFNKTNNITVFVIGLGSMGKRRIRLLKQYNEDIKIFGIDSREDRRQESEEKYGINTLKSLSECEHYYETNNCAFVCTSPLSHAEIIRECIEQGMHVFSEINLVSTLYDENMARAKQKGLVLFLSSTFMYRKEIVHIKERLQDAGRVNYTYHVGQYLPDWHPWERYKDFFVVKKETNGCREYMAIDLPWIIDLFGKVESFSVLKDNMTDLDVDYPDNILIQVIHKNSNRGLIAVDVATARGIRSLEIYGVNTLIQWRGTPDTLTVYDKEKKSDKQISLYKEYDKRDEYCSFVIEDAYLEEIKAFFEEINGISAARYSFEKDKEILDLIDRIENK